MEEHSVDRLHTSAEGILDLVSRLRKDAQLPDQPLVMMGFSQGAALAFVAAHLSKKLSLRNVDGVIALAGFLPTGDLGRLDGVSVFWGHGTRDEQIPIKTAYSGIRRLEALGAQVAFCEADVEHKLGVECLRGLRQWMQETFPGGER
jgi:predicted esterase